MARGPYRWRCFSCDAGNDAKATKCTNCGFPASASGREIAKAQLSRRPASIEPLKRLPTSSTESLTSLLEPLIWWRKALAIAGIGTMIVGVIGFKLTFSWSGTAISVAILVAGLGILALAVNGTSVESPEGGARHG